MTHSFAAIMTQYFAVFDAAAARYVDPFAASTLEVALRGFREACETPEHQFAKYPEDYSLWHVGEFDQELGVMTGITAVKIATASSFVVNAPLNIQAMRESLEVREEEA